MVTAEERAKALKDQQRARVQAEKERAQSEAGSGRFVMQPDQTKRVQLLTPWEWVVAMAYHYTFSGEKKFTVFCPLLSGPMVDGRVMPISGMEDYKCEYCKMTRAEREEKDIRTQVRWHMELWDTTLDHGKGGVAITDYAWNSTSPYDSMEEALSEARENYENPRLAMTDISFNLKQKDEGSKRRITAYGKKALEVASNVTDGQPTRPASFTVRPPSQIVAAQLRWRGKSLLKEEAIKKWMASLDDGYVPPKHCKVREEKPEEDEESSDRPRARALSEEEE